MTKIIYIALLLSLTLLNAQGTTQLQVTESAEFSDDISLDAGVLAIHTTAYGKTGLIRGNKNNFQLYVFDNQLSKVFSKKVVRDKR